MSKSNNQCRFTIDFARPRNITFSWEYSWSNCQTLKQSRNDGESFNENRWFTTRRIRLPLRNFPQKSFSQKRQKSLPIESIKILSFRPSETFTRPSYASREGKTANRRRSKCSESFIFTTFLPIKQSNLENLYKARLSLPPDVKSGI